MSYRHRVVASRLFNFLTNETRDPSPRRDSSKTTIGGFPVKRSGVSVKSNPRFLVTDIRLLVLGTLSFHTILLPSVRTDGSYSPITSGGRGWWFWSSEVVFEGCDWS